MLFTGCSSFAGDSARVRPPAVAGQFYPDNPSELKKDVQGYIAGGKKETLPPVLLICPHAGYIYSGPVAGKAYATIDKAIMTVILIGPSHHALFKGIAISDAAYYETPLGKVPLAGAIIAGLEKSGLAQVVPQAEAPEHCLEVQLPFLQATLTSFSIVPVLTGDVSPEAVADLLYPYINKTTLVVASSDLSHYHPSSEAKMIDARTVGTVLSGNSGGFLDACGETAIRVVMLLARKMALSPRLLDARNSFETAPLYCSENQVVGYAAIAYFKEKK